MSDTSSMWRCDIHGGHGFKSDCISCRKADKRIKELAAENEQWIEVDARRFADITKLTDENERLREAAERVAFEAEADDWACEPSIQACKNLAALLEKKR